MNKEIFDKLFPENNAEKIVEKARLILFLIAMSEAGFVCLLIDKTGMLNTIVLCASVITAALFIAFAFILKRQSYKIIFISIIIYSVIIILNCLTDFTIFQSLIPMLFLYSVLIAIAFKLKEIKTGNN